MSDELEFLRRQNAQLQQQLAHARLELEDFSYSVSHDLRASLRHVTAYLQIIVDEAGDALDEVNRAHLVTIERAARHMERLMDGLMELPRLGRVELQHGAVDLGALLAEVQQGLAPELTNRVVDWHVALDMPVVWGDAALLREVMQQLLGNALKFSPRDKPARIEVSWEPGHAGQCVLWVQDAGVGFKPEYAPKLFHAFSRLHRAADFEGLGMGLALCRRIVERHGGSISASAALGAGCRVRLTLPLA